MKKKILFTSLMVACGALALASCSKKPVKNTDTGEKTNEVTSNVTTSNEQQNNDNLNGAFFADDAFELTEFNPKDLTEIKLSLRQQTLLENYTSASNTAYVGNLKGSLTQYYDGQLINGEFDSSFDVRKYSNDVATANAKVNYVGDRISSFIPVKPPVDLPVLASIDLPVKAIEPKEDILIPSIKPVAKIGGIPDLHSLPKIGSVELNATFAEYNSYTYEETNYNNSSIKNTYKNVSWATAPIDSIMENYMPDKAFYLPFQTKKSYYQYDNNIFVVEVSSSYTDNDNVQTGEDPNTGSAIYTNAKYTITLKNYAFFELTENSFNEVFEYKVLEEKTNVIMSEYAPEYYDLGEMKTVFKAESYTKISNAEVEYKKQNEFINSFKETNNIVAANCNFFDLTKDESGNVTAVSSSGVDGCNFEILKKENGKINVDFVMEVYNSDTFNTSIGIVEGELNSKVLEGKELAEDETVYNTNTKTVEFDLSDKLNDEFSITNFDGKKYITFNRKNKDDYYTYTLIINADIEKTTDGYTVKVNSVDTIKTFNVFM